MRCQTEIKPLGKASSPLLEQVSEQDSNGGDSIHVQKENFKTEIRKVYHDIDCFSEGKESAPSENVHQSTTQVPIKDGAHLNLSGYDEDDEGDEDNHIDNVINVYN